MIRPAVRREQFVSIRGQWAYEQNLAPAAARRQTVSGSGGAGRGRTASVTRSVAPLAAVVALFVVSGATALIYEVIWTRSLTLFFGKTVQAASAVLAAYMAGLALGSLMGGRVADRARRAGLLAYAALEAGIGLWALLLPFVIHGVGLLYVALSGPFERLSATLEIARFLLATLAMIPATAMMGATLPVLARWAVRQQEHVASRLGLLYALNTLGGVIGCLGAGFALLELIGVSRTTLVAVGGNFLVALVAWLMQRGTAETPAAPEPGARAPSATTVAPEPAIEPVRLAIVLAAVFFSGFGALALEVVWTRTLLLVFGSTIYSFTTMLAVFLTGIGLGSLLMTPFADRLKRPWLALGLIQGGIGVLVLLSTRAVDAMPGLYLDMVAHGHLTWQRDLVAKFVLSASLMLLPTLLSGAVWPVAVRIVRPRRAEVGAQVGRLYAANTLGSIVGSLSGAFLLLPALGMQNSMIAISVLVAGAGATLVLAETMALPRRAVAAFVIVALAAGLALTGRPWDRKRLTSGAYFMPTYYLDDAGEPHLEEHLDNARLLYYAEGVTTTPSVALLGGVNRAFFNDGKIEGGTAMDGMRLLRLLGHLPFLMKRGEAHTALNIGLGSGITAGAMGVHPVERIDCAELEPAVVGAARLFDDATFHILDRPGLRMIYNDGRNHLLLSSQRYDVITSMPFAPLVEGAANVFSLEHFQLVRDHLAPDGMTSQWVGLYELSPTDYLSILRTFADVFPDATVWFTGIETILLGSDGPQQIDFATLAERMKDEKVAASLREIGLDDPMRLLSTYCFRLSDVIHDLEGAPLNTDDRPRLEFTAPRSHLVNTVKDNLPWLAARRRSPAPLVRFPGSWSPDDERRSQLLRRLDISLAAQNLGIQGRLEALEGRLEESIATLMKAVDTDPGDQYARDLASRNLVKLADRRIEAGAKDEGIEDYRKALQVDPNSFLALYNLAGFAYERGDHERAWDLTRRALEIAPESATVRYRLGLMLYNRQEYSTAEKQMEKALSFKPHYPDPLMVLGDIETIRGDPAGAASMYQRAIDAGKRDAEAYAALSQALAGSKRPDEAERALAQARRLAPEDPEVIYSEARLEAARGHDDEAARRLDAAIRAGGERYRYKAMQDPAMRRLLDRAHDDGR